MINSLFLITHNQGKQITVQASNQQSTYVEISERLVQREHKMKGCQRKRAKGECNLINC